MFEQLTDLVFPASCLVCGQKPKPLCLQCLPVFGPAAVQGTAYFAHDLDAELNQILGTLKDKNRTALIPILSNALRPCLKLAMAELAPELLVCPPSAKALYRKRGFNPALEIFKHANQTSVPVTDRLLVFTRQPKDQRQLSKIEREQNVHNLFSARPIRKRLLLVDDVFTTGSTLSAAREALEKAGAEVVGSCVLARRL